MARTEPGPLLRAIAKEGRLAVLDAVASAESPLSVNDVARRARVPVRTAWRAVQELARLGILDAPQDRRRAYVRLRSESIATKALGALLSIEGLDPFLWTAEHALGQLRSKASFDVAAVVRRPRDCERDGVALEIVVRPDGSERELLEAVAEVMDSVHAAGGTAFTLSAA